MFVVRQGGSHVRLVMIELVADVAIIHWIYCSAPSALYELCMQQLY